MKSRSSHATLSEPLLNSPQPDLPPPSPATTSPLPRSLPPPPPAFRPPLSSPGGDPRPGSILRAASLLPASLDAVRVSPVALVLQATDAALLRHRDLVPPPLLHVHAVQLLLLLHASNGPRQALGDADEGGHAGGVAGSELLLLLRTQLHPAGAPLVDLRLQRHQLPAQLAHAPTQLGPVLPALHTHTEWRVRGL